MSALVLRHDVGSSLTIGDGEVDLVRYVYVPDTPRLESPKPFLHPIQEFACLNPAPLREFHAAAAALVRGRAGRWPAIVRDGPLSRAETGPAVTSDLTVGVAGHLERAAVFQAPEHPGERAFGMCGRLRPYAVDQPVVEKEHTS